jgi:cytoskeleton protein RodZ
MPTVGEQLRRAREERELTVYQVAEATKIKTDHIRALEAGDFEAFVAPVYIRGFARNYARFLKLDEAGLSAELETELAGTERFREPPSLLPPASGPLDFLMLQVSKVNWRIVVLIALGAAVGVFGLRTLVGSGSPRPENPLKRLGPGLYQPPGASGELLPLPTHPATR